MIEHPPSDAVYCQVPPPLYRLAGLVCTGYGSVAGRTERLERTCASYGVLYLQIGSGWVKTAATSGRIAVEAGALVWLFPGVAHTLAPAPPGWSEQWVLFEGSLAYSFELLGLLSRAQPVVRPTNPAQVSGLFTQIRADFAAEGSRAGLLAAASIHRLVIEAHGGVSLARGPSSRTQTIERAVALIDAWALQPFDPRSVAEECGVGYSTLRRRFKQATGHSISAYVLRRRLDAARELLTTAMSVAEVAHATGFSDPYYFSRQFHRQEGISPSTFRARHLQDE